MGNFRIGRRFNNSFSNSTGLLGKYWLQSWEFNDMGISYQHQYMHSAGM